MQLDDAIDLDTILADLLEQDLLDIMLAPQRVPNATSLETIAIRVRDLIERQIAGTVFPGKRGAS